MKKFRRDTRGQFVVISALLIAILTLSLVLSIHYVNTNMQELSYEPVQELVLGITSDLDRTLTYALSNATKVYNDTGSKDAAIKSGTAFISKWERSIRTSYANLGINMSMTIPGTGGDSIDNSVYWSISWSNATGISQVYTKFDLDIDAYGFKGWVGASGKFVSLQIFPETITHGSDNKTTLTFQIMQGKEEDVPISNLTPESLRIWLESATPNIVDITSLNYIGSGNYSVTFTPSPDEHTRRVTILVMTPEDNIIVSAYVENLFTVNLYSQEYPSNSTNLGSIQLGNTNYLLSPYGRTTMIPPGEYLLRYFAEDGYTFLNWTTSPQIKVTNDTSRITSVKIEGNGNITAFYTQIEGNENITGFYNVSLSSRHWAYLPPSNLGNITLHTETNTSLPRSINITGGDYLLKYEPKNASYVFLRWEQSGNAIPWVFTNPSTFVTIFGDGNITAIYGLITEPLPPLENPWDTLYVDRKDQLATLVPPHLRSLKSSHIPSWASSGKDKQMVEATSPPCPTIYLARYLTLTAYLRVDPAWNVKEVAFEFGFIYSGNYYLLGNSTSSVSSSNVYISTFDIGSDVYIVPEGSIFILKAEVTFTKQPWGTFKLYYGPSNPTSIKLC